MKDTFVREDDSSQEIWSPIVDFGGTTQQTASTEEGHVALTVVPPDLVRKHVDYDFYNFVYCGVRYLEICLCSSKRSSWVSSKVARNGLDSLQGYWRFSRGISIFHIISQFEVLHPIKYFVSRWCSYMVSTTKFFLMVVMETVSLYQVTHCGSSCGVYFEFCTFLINCVWLNLFGLSVQFLNRTKLSYS